MRKALTVLSLSMCCGSAALADKIYVDTPSDVSAIVVEGGRFTTAGLAAYREHLKQYWKFDDSGDIFANSAGALTLADRTAGSVVHKTGEDSKIGGGAAWTADGFRVSENVIDGKSPFTVMFWLKKDSWKNNQETLVYIGQKPEDNGTAAQENNFLRMSFGNRHDRIATQTSDELYLWDNYGNRINKGVDSLGTPGQWNHIALTCARIESADGTPKNEYSLFVNGSLLYSCQWQENDFASDDNLFFGYGWHYAGSERTMGDGVFDEIMIFDSALDAGTITSIKDKTQPFEFSANWLFPTGEGTLDLYGAVAQTVSGYGGVVTNDVGITLVPARNATFAGEISGGGLTLDAASSSVTQTLAGANSYSGPTHVKNGVLAVNPMAAFPALESTLVAYYPCDNLSASGQIADMSGNGNHLSPVTGAGDASADSVDCIADAALHLPASGDEKYGFRYPSTLNGFDPEADNSFVVAFWMRIDKSYYREGPFHFDTYSGARFNGDKGEDTSGALYFGDRFNSKIIRYFFEDGYRFGNGQWRHFAVAYDSAKANGTDDCYFLYMNGVLAAKSPNYDSINHATNSFTLGNGLSGTADGNDTPGINGALDDVVLLNGSSSDDIAKLYNWRKGAYEAETAGGVLPETTHITVDPGATLYLTNSCEKVRSISGAGTVYISAGSVLEVNYAAGFTGTVLGGGRLIRHGFKIFIR